MNDISKRIANLSPEKRELLELLSKKKMEGISTQKEAIKPSVDSDEDLIEGDMFSIGDDRFTPEKDEVKRFYDSVNSQLNASSFGEHSIFLNYGYVPNDNRQYSQIKLPDVFLNKNASRLVLEVIGDCELRPKDKVLDIGCGRGGTVSVFNRFFKVRSITGVDLSSNAISFCQKVHNYSNVSFQEGDAENLSFENQSFDIATNLESSHSYYDIFAFYKEVYRVLKPDGYFLYADLVSNERIGDYKKFLEDLGFVIEREQDITGNILLSCDEVANTHSRAYTKENDSDLMDNFLAVPDSHVYHEMKNGKTKYLLFKIHKKN